ncbi:hypothetical protein RCL00_24795, partial [Salmonella enterica subsp. enterica serovar 1,4,[5],12:i:-]
IEQQLLQLPLEVVVAVLAQPLAHGQVGALDDASKGGVGPGVAAQPDIQPGDACCRAGGHVQGEGKAALAGGGGQLQSDLRLKVAQGVQG